MRMQLRIRSLTFPFLVSMCFVAGPTQPVVAAPGHSLDRVLTLAESRTGPHALSVDRGASGLWQGLLRLQTTASVLYTIAHPDDEQGGTLTHLSRGRGVRTSLLSLKPRRGRRQCHRFRAV